VKVGKPAGSIEFGRVQLIDSTLEDQTLVVHGVGNQNKTYYPPCKHDGEMKRDEGGKELDCYERVIGHLYLAKFTRGNTAISVYPCARYLSQPGRISDEAANQIGRHLVGTWDKGFSVWLEMRQSFDCYVEAASCGNRDPMYSEGPNLAKSKMGYVIMYCGCPILWASRLQSAFAPSTMESKYVARSAASRYVILVMDLLKEMQDRVYDVEGNLWIKCKLCADSSGVSEPAKTFTLFALNGSLETPSISEDSYSGGTISPSKMKEREDIGFWSRLNWSDVTEHHSQICQG
jgi:hypothetical protein